MNDSTLLRLGAVVLPALLAPSAASAATILQITSSRTYSGTDMWQPAAARTSDILSRIVVRSGSAETGCLPASDGSLTGAIAVVARGTYSMGTKTASSTASGALGTIVTDNVARDAAPSLTQTDDAPALTTTLAVGQAIRATAKAGPAWSRLGR